MQAPHNFVQQLTDPVSGKKFKPAAASPRSMHGTQVFLFENAANKAAFDKEPAKYARFP